MFPIRMRYSARIAAASVVGAFFMAVTATAASFYSTDEEIAPISTPKGVTLQPLGKYQGYGLDQETAALNGHDKIAFASADGKTFYTYGPDPVGQSVCKEKCAEIWPPAEVIEGAEPVGHWTIIERGDGTRQWALHGKPLYTYVKDVDVGSVGGNSPKRYGRGPHIGERGAKLAPIPEDEPLPENWAPALQFPTSTDLMPPDLSVREIQDATGLALVSSEDRTLYVFDSDINSDMELCGSPCPWSPVIAPQLASTIGDFVAVSRTDGVRQWTYKGLGLYTFAGDLGREDANGDGVYENWHVAHVERNYMLDSVSIQVSHRLGKVLATAEGQTLYRRDSYLFQSGSGHGQRRGVLVRPAVGRDIGTDPKCREQCDMWHPFLAPDDAVARGYWDVYPREDGTRQWAYQGYALWTYDGDKSPGDINADDDWQITWDISQDSAIDIGTPYDGVAALYWAAAFP